MLFNYCLALLLLSALWMSPSLAADWPLTVSPEVINLEADEGDELTQAIVLRNTEDWPAPVRLEAVNWSYDAMGVRLFGSEAKVDADCRGWWAAGFDDLLVQPLATVVYDLTLQVPDDIEETECHFALAVIPASGEERYARRYIPVYINVEGAEAELELDSVVMGRDAAGKKQPIMVVRNVGTARSRIYGMLEGEDVQGQALDLVIRPTEILAGETRAVPLLVSREGGGEVWWSTPLEIEGTLTWDDGEIDIDVELP